MYLRFLAADEAAKVLAVERVRLVPVIPDDEISDPTEANSRDLQLMWGDEENERFSTLTTAIYDRSERPQALEKGGRWSVMMMGELVLGKYVGDTKRAKNYVWSRMREGVQKMVSKLHNHQNGSSIISPSHAGSSTCNDSAALNNGHPQNDYTKKLLPRSSRITSKITPAVLHGHSRLTLKGPTRSNSPRNSCNLRLPAQPPRRLRITHPHRLLLLPSHPLLSPLSIPPTSRFLRLHVGRTSQRNVGERTQQNFGIAGILRKERTNVRS